MSPALDPKKLAKLIQAYRQAMAAARAQEITTELGLKHAFGNLLREAVKLVRDADFREEHRPEGDNSKQFDGAIIKNFLTRGVWEAKGPGANLAAEVDRKIKRGYPLDNILFEDTQAAILYQDGVERGRFDLALDDKLADLLNLFLNHSSEVQANFDTAVNIFKDTTIQLSKDLDRIVKKAHADTPAFRDAFAKFADLCRESINPGLADADIDNLLIQHLLLQRLIERIFSADFFRENALAREIEAVVTTLTGASFSREAFFRGLDRFYLAIEGAANEANAHPDAWTAKQRLLNGVYEKFFQGYDPDVADTHGIVYTPQPIVDFMCVRVAEVLQAEFGLGLGDTGVVILDPCTGTGNFGSTLGVHTGLGGFA